MGARVLGGVQGGASGDERAFGGGKFGAGQGGLRVQGGTQRLAFVSRLVQSAAGAGNAGLGLLDPGLGGAAQGVLGGQVGGQPLDLGFGGGAGGFGGVGGGRQLWPALRRGGDLGLQRGQIVGQPRQGQLGVLGNVRLAGAVGVDALQVAGEPGQLSGVGVSLAVDPILVDGQFVQDRRRDRLGVPQRLEGRLGVGRPGRGQGRRAGGLLDGADRGGRLGRQAFRRRLGLGPLGVEHGALQRADFGGEFPVPLGLPRLAPQPAQVGVQFAGHILQPGQVGVRRAQPQFGFMPPGMQSRDPRSLFEDQPAVLGFGGDQFGDLTLTDQGGGVRAR